MTQDNHFAKEFSELAVLIGRLKRGELTRPEFRSQSVHLGVYTQRQPDRYFMRIRVPLGVLTVPQLNALAETAERWADGECHLTTRQGVEIHNLSLDGTLEASVGLASVGLSSHESGGNTVRGIVVCPHAGNDGNEPFDVTEYAALLNRHFLRHPDFQTLPRKIKIGFSCCADDCAHTALQDIGFQARTDAVGQRGFRVLVGGGTGALPRLAKELIVFLPARDLLVFTEAFLRMFNRLGDRQNRRRARVKFLVESHGLERLRAEVLNEWDALKTARQWPSVEQPISPPPQDASRCNLHVAFPGGNFTSNRLRQLATLTKQYSLNLRITPEQEFLIRGIHPDQLSHIHATLLEAGLVPKNVALHLISCPGSTACSNAFTNSRALADVLSQRLAETENLGSLRIRVSGCTNGCALHVMSDIGLEGLAQRRDGALIPAYRLWLGGRVHQQHPSLAADLGIVPARQVADCVFELVSLYQRERHSGESLSDILHRIGVKPFAAVAQRHHESGDLRDLATDIGEQTAYRAQADAPATTC
jgi:sulfite reductase beta subunit-like hemoprotein